MAWTRRTKVLAAAATITTALALPAYAQDGGGKAPHPDDIAKKQRADEADRGYKILLEMQKGRAQEGKLDPWANIRPAENAPAPKSKKSN